MKRHLLFTTLIALFVAAPRGDAQKGSASKDLQPLQGTWSVVALRHDGKDVPKDKVEGIKFTVKGDHYTLKGGGDDYRGTLSADASTSPKQLDATFVDDQGKEKGRAQGIYEVSGETLKIRWREKGDGGRPKDFTGETGTGVRSIVLRRDAGGAKQ